MAAAAVAAAVYGGVAFGAASGPGAQPKVTEATNRAAAEADAADLLSRLQLPAGATYSPVEPAGTNPGLYEFVPASPPEPRTLVDRGGWWIVPERPDAALESIEANPPAGSRLGLHGTREANAKSSAEVRYAEFDWPPVPGVLGQREIFVIASKQPDGSAVLRIDSGVVWIVPHPPAERIPSAAHALEIELTRHGKASRSVTVTNPRAVGRIAAQIDALPVRQPDPLLCDSSSDGTRYKLTFRTSAAGPPLAEATQALPLIPGCNVMRLNIAGKRQMPLERGGIVLRTLRPLRAAHLPQD